MGTVFLTGFPGFLGTEVVRGVLERGDDEILCVVQPKFAGMARSRVAELAVDRPDAARRLTLLEGDITVSGLGLDNPGPVLRRVTEVHHLAAVYDLSVTREVGMRVNVEGTRQALAFGAACPELRRLHYVSTCYVSGRHLGVFAEDDLDVGQTFNNFYEETKYLAEVEVQAAMREGIPATVYRPSVVVGDSRTGATQKFDGPYYVILSLLRQPRVAVIPVFGDPTQVAFNMVPRDFVVSALLHLSGLDRSLGKVYQLADPRPPSVATIIRDFGTATGRRVVALRVPRRLTHAVARRLERQTGVPAATLHYFDHPTHYGTSQSRADLAGSGIAPPPFASYSAGMVAFVRANPTVTSAAMV